MGSTIQFESHKVELAFIREYEFAPNVLEYYDQPEPIKISYRTVSGRLVTTLTTPDFFVIHNDGTAGWEECKTEEELKQLAEKSERFVRDEDKKWRCPSGEEYAARYGLYFRVRSSSEINWIFQRNLEYLSDYLLPHKQTVNSPAEPFIKAIVTCKQGILLSDLIRNAEPYTSDDILQMIASNTLYVNLHLHALSEQDRTPVYTDMNHVSELQTSPTPRQNISAVNLEAGAQITWDGKLFQIVNMGDGNIWVNNDQGQLTSIEYDRFENLVRIGAIVSFETQDDINEICRILKSKHPESYVKATERYNAIAGYLAGTDTTNKTRTLRRWLKNYKDAESIYGNGFLGLFDGTDQKGNRLLKLPTESYKIMQTCIEEQFLSSTGIQPLTVYGHYCNQCRKSNVIAASFKTFTVKLKQLDPVTTESKRKGPRVAYQLEEFYWELDLTTPRHGERPFEIAHIDHTELDIELVDSKTWNNLGRPWLTLMTDSCSRRILAYVLSFESPSYRACMLAMRECVRRHNRLPQTLVADNGAEFRSIYYEQLMAFHKITKKNRPKAKARYGAVLERLFGTTNTQFIHALTGNTKIMRNVRQVSKSFNPKNLAAWTFAALQERIGEYFSEVYEQLDHPALGESPIKAFERGLANHGMRPTRFIRYDDAFIFSTLPSTPKGHAKVIRSRGIKINNMYYWHEALRNAVDSSVPVRYDPYDIASAYALIKGQWVHCRSQNYSILKGRSQKELAAITQELFKLHSNHNAKIAVNAQMVAAFITKTQETESELKLMRKAAEMRMTATDAITPDNSNTDAAPERPDMDSKTFEIYDELVV